MKCVILAGGFGSRISEESFAIPKPMVEVGGKPILWHVMKIYSHYGIKDFILCTGYKEYVIKEYFMNYFLHNSDVTFNLKDDTYTVHNTFGDDWNVSVINTGLHTLTAGRMKRIYKYLEDDDFCMTYGDGVSDVNISEIIQFHKKHRKLATITTIQQIQRFGIMDVEENSGKVLSFSEKPTDNNGFINGGFFVLSRKVIEEYIDDSDCMFEQKPLQNLAKDGELMSFKHNGFWKCMDTLRDKIALNDLWNANEAKWKVW